MSEVTGKVKVKDRGCVGFFGVLGGVGLFFVFQYGVALMRLTAKSEGMENKFSVLAKDKYMGFLVWQNVYVLVAYVILAVLFSLVLMPFVKLACERWKLRAKRWVIGLGLAGAFLIHGFFTLRLVQTRPYFLDDAKFGYWYYEIINVVPDVMKPVVFFLLFTVIPLLVVGYVLVWYLRFSGALGRGLVACLLVVVACLIFWKSSGGRSDEAETTGMEGRPNILVIGSDSLRGDKLGYAGYVPRRTDGLAAGGVSPRIDKLAGRSVDFANCYTPIASTLESGTSFMTSEYPQSHGFRHMYPSAQRVAETKGKILPLATVLKNEGYDTAVFGDWCAGYFELMPLGFEHVSVSSFDNFQIYMSQAVVMAHFVVPLYFDHPLGYAIFPQLGSFAQFVTPDVVTDRVEKRLAGVAGRKKPFFWHVFYSCNHLPYRNPEPYSSMFTDPGYEGVNKNGVDFDIDSFIGGTDLENKWKALPKKEIRQIRDLYDGCTRQFDDNVGRMLDALEKNGLAENTIVIVTADHGDNLYEEGVTLGHGLTFNGGMQANHVPMLVHVPGVEASTFKEHVRIIDVAPTLADLVGVEKPKVWEGTSVAGWIDGSEEPRSLPFYGETGFPFIQFRVEGVVRPELPPMDGMTRIDDSFNYQFVLKEEYEEPLVDAKQRCLMTDGWKMICTPMKGGGRHFGLFARGEGADVGLDVSQGNPEVLGIMKAALERWMDEGVETLDLELPGSKSK
ncbi:MAG: sulfatase family protein [Luteolibacter sp.]